MTEFAIGNYVEPAAEPKEEDEDPDSTDPIVPEDDDDDYVYIFWGCMNAFYVCLILWFWYIILALVCRKMDKGSDDQRPSTE